MMDRKIKEVALIGTGRKTINIDELNPLFKEKIDANSTEENKLLQVLTYESYSVHGNIPTKISVLESAEIIEESKTYLPKEACEKLSQIFALDTILKEVGMKMFIDQVINADRIVLPEFVLKLLKEGNAFNKNTRKDILKIIGERGKLILPLMKGLKYEVAETVSWEVASYAERKELFDEMRKVESAPAIEKLKATWSTEGIKEKLGFLKIISDTLDASDESFLKEIFEAEFKKSLSKKTEIECKSIIVSMLLRLRSNPIYEEVKTKLKAYVNTTSHKVLGISLGKETYEFKTPISNDNFFDGALLKDYFGFEEKNIDVALFDNDNLSFLAQMIEVFPMKLWAELMHKDIKLTVEYFNAFTTKIKGENVSIFKSFIITNAINNNEEEVATAISQIYPNDYLSNIVHLLPQKDFESYISKGKFYNNSDLFLARPRSEATKWSHVFTKNYISEIITLYKSNPYHGTKIHGQVLALYMSKEAIPDVMKYNDYNESAPWLDQFKKFVIGVVVSWWEVL